MEILGASEFDSVRVGAACVSLGMCISGDAWGEAPSVIGLDLSLFCLWVDMSARLLRDYRVAPGGRAKFWVSDTAILCTTPKATRFLAGNLIMLRHVPLLASIYKPATNARIRHRPPTSILNTSLTFHALHLYSTDWHAN